MELVIATGNRGKLKEIQERLAGLSLVVRGLQDFPSLPTPAEDGVSFEENARIKARYYAQRLGKTVLADDSGLEVDALEGRPGVYSARFAGEGSSDEQNNQKLLAAMEAADDADRGARFVCVLAVVDPEGREMLVRGECAGRILREKKGAGGFGYDPLFQVEGNERTFAEMTPEEKARYSHRGHALNDLREKLPSFLTQCE